MREIVPGISMWSWLSEPHGYNFNGHLLEDAAGNICIDPVEPGADGLAELARRGVARIVLTNRNHVRAANMVRARTRARTAIHSADASYARNQGAELDDELQVGVAVGPLIVVAVPGKSPGEIALHWPARRLLIVGDALIGNPPGACRLLRDAVMDDPARLRTSVRALLDLDFDTLLVGDGEPIIGGAKERVRALVETFGT
jgi:glyoxylase-like metal-dependent hydrolase (beta-lactamase superfamily II)